METMSYSAVKSTLAESRVLDLNREIHRVFGVEQRGGLHVNVAIPEAELGHLYESYEERQEQQEVH